MTTSQITENMVDDTTITRTDLSDDDQQDSGIILLTVIMILRKYK